jgi:hypothetical protein
MVEHTIELAGETVEAYRRSGAPELADGFHELSLLPHQSKAELPVLVDRALTSFATRNGGLGNETVI